MSGALVFVVLMFAGWAIYAIQKKSLVQQPNLEGPKQYVDSGYDLTMDIIRELSLPDWADGRPLLTESNQEAVSEAVNEFLHGSDKFAQETGSQSIQYHPELQAHIDRALVDCALREAVEKTKGSADWQADVSTLLKAWASGLNPSAMLSVAEILADKGKIALALKALSTVARFECYFLAKPENDLEMLRLAYITISAILPRLTWGGYTAMGDSDFAAKISQRHDFLKREILGVESA